MQKTHPNATIVDVRSPEEFSQEHYPGAINIPIEQVPHRIDEFRTMDTPIIAYCRSGNRSEMAVAILKQAGLHDVHNGGGLEDMIHLKK